MGKRMTVFDPVRQKEETTFLRVSAEACCGSFVSCRQSIFFEAGNERAHLLQPH